MALYTKRSDATEDIKYFHADHLGSTSVVTSSTGAVLERLAYDPWGDRRAGSGAGDPSHAIIPATTDRGYTGHEHLDLGGMGLVHMNGRIYDPTLGRFLSPDPYIQSPFHSQSLNRYSYVWNNPLSNTDPSGYQVQSVPTVNVNAARLPPRCETSGGVTTCYDVDLDLSEPAIAPTINRIIPRRPGNSLEKSWGIQVRIKNALDQWVDVSDGNQAQMIIASLVAAGATIVVPDSGAQLILTVIGGKLIVGTAAEIKGFLALRRAAAVEEPAAGAAKEAGILANGVRGRAAETRVLEELGLARNTRAVSTAEGRAIPDALTNSLSIEIKDTLSVSRTAQIRIETDAARAAGRESVLITGERTCVSGPCANAFDRIIRRSDLGPQ